LEYAELRIPKSLYERLKQDAERLGQDPVTLAVNLLREKLSEIEEELLNSDIPEEEKEEIKERLRRLGYL